MKKQKENKKSSHEVEVEGMIIGNSQGPIAAIGDVAIGEGEEGEPLKIRFLPTGECIIEELEREEK